MKNPWARRAVGIQRPKDYKDGNRRRKPVARVWYQGHLCVGAVELNAVGSRGSTGPSRLDP